MSRPESYDGPHTEELDENGNDAEDRLMLQKEKEERIAGNILWFFCLSVLSIFPITLIYHLFLSNYRNNNGNPDNTRLRF